MGCSTSYFDWNCEDIFLRNTNTKNTKKFIPNITRGRVIKVYDGDTITVAARLDRRGKIYKFNVRLNRIDAPEMKSNNRDEKIAAIAAKEALSGKILNKCITLDNVSVEKYGRVLADIHYRNLCLNDWMLSEKYAVIYDGGTKSTINWKNYRK